MSINQFSSDLPDTIWWTQHHAMDPNSHTNNNNSSSPDAIMQHHHKIAPSGNYNQLYHHHPQWYDPRQSASTVLTPRNFNLNNNDVGDDEDDDRSSTVGQQQHRHELIDKEGMFEKPLTPSDVGKLNRLVIPKQHAEKYFPLGGDSGDKGLLLGFEDESGKSWRFRYSYWNSSQSYVLTKGWSRYVKEKQLDAGDVVFFERHRTDGERFFIGWRRRNAPLQEGSVTAAQPSTAPATGDQWTRVFYPAHAYPAHHGLSPTVAVPYQPHCTHAGTGTIVPTTVPAGNLKRLRLFGVNMECHQSEDYEPSTPDGSSSVSSQGGANYHPYQHYYPSQAHQNQMDTTCSGDVNQQMMRRGRG